MKLREFKVRQLITLKQIEKELIKKHPEKEQRIRYIVDLLASKLETLRIYTLFDYIYTLHLASREFPEFEKMIPKPEEVNELLKGGEE